MFRVDQRRLGLMCSLGRWCILPQEEEVLYSRLRDQEVNLLVSSVASNQRLSKHSTRMKLTMLFMISIARPRLVA